MVYTASQRLTHFFHVVSNIRPIIWIGLYVSATPIFALVYWALPDGQFRFPEGEATNYGSWLYYSIVTITTLGFGDYTPCHPAAQAVTAIEVMCGLIFLGLFLNAVGSMKSEIDVESEIEKQRRAHYALELGKLLKSVPMVLHSLDTFQTISENFSPQSGNDYKRRSLLRSASHASMALDSLQQRVDLSLWPELLEDAFAFVANYQIFSAGLLSHRHKLADENNKNDSNEESLDLQSFINENRKLALALESHLTSLATEKQIVLH